METSRFALHLEDLAIWLPYCCEFSPAERSSIDANLIDLHERLS